MPNIRYANMCHWKTIPYRKIENFREFYYEDNTNSAYYSDWDNILEYQSALGFDGIEIAPGTWQISCPCSDRPRISPRLPRIAASRSACTTSSSARSTCPTTAN